MARPIRGAVVSSIHGKNRSVPTNTILPHVTYQNVADAITWLTETFGFTEQYRYGDPGVPVSGAQMHLGDSSMANASTESRTSHAQDVSPDEWGAIIAARP